MKPLKDYAPFTIGERFEDGEGDVLEIVEEGKYKWLRLDGRKVNGRSWCINVSEPVRLCKPLDRQSEALDELAQLDADEVCGPKLWCEMTDDEKAPILLAWAEGRRIEWMDDDGSWSEIYLDPTEWDADVYRIAPEEVRETVSFTYPLDTHSITFDTINGEPVLDSVRMVKL